MKQVCTIAFVFGLLCSTSVFAAGSAKGHRSVPGNFAAGIVLGEPTGLSGKLWTDSTHAFDMGLAFSVNDYVLFFVDYLFHFPGALGHSSDFISHLKPYLGVGGVMAFSSSRRSSAFFGTSSTTLGLGVRVPAGIEWRPSDVPIGVFAELVPGISLTPSTSALIWGGIGIRYYF